MESRRRDYIGNEEYTNRVSGVSKYKTQVFVLGGYDFIQ